MHRAAVNHRNEKHRAVYPRHPLHPLHRCRTSRTSISQMTARATRLCVRRSWTKMGTLFHPQARSPKPSFGRAATPGVMCWLFPSNACWHRGGRCKKYRRCTDACPIMFSLHNIHAFYGGGFIGLLSKWRIRCDVGRPTRCKFMVWRWSSSVSVQVVL